MCYGGALHPIGSLPLTDQQHLGWVDAQGEKALGVQQGQLHHFTQLLQGVTRTANIVVCHVGLSKGVGRWKGGLGGGGW